MLQSCQSLIWRCVCTHTHTLTAKSVGVRKEWIDYSKPSGKFTFWVKLVEVIGKKVKCSKFAWEFGRWEVCDLYSLDIQVKSVLRYRPVSHMVNEMLFEHEAPLFDNVKQGTFHKASINPHPSVEHLNQLHGLHLQIDLLKPCKHIANIPETLVFLCFTY